jgi:SAM-dependent methyltransferase
MLHERFALALGMENSMTDSTAGFIGNIPEEYDRGLGPVIFADFAADMARRASAGAPARVLEVAAGTGIVTRLLRDLLPGSAHLTATDLNPPMLQVASNKFRADERVTFKPADATNLPFPDGAFDTVVCQFGVMFFPDKDRAWREVHRVLAPGGRYLFSVWDSQACNPFGRIAHEVASRYFPADPPRFYQVPFSMHAIDPIKQGLITAGFTDISIHVLARDKSVADPAAFARGLILGNPVVDEIRSRANADPDTIVAALTEALSQAFAASGRMPLQTIMFEARRK